MLACLDGYMNIAMEQTEEYVNGQLKAKYGDTFIRGNNGEAPSIRHAHDPAARRRLCCLIIQFSRAALATIFSDATCTVLYISTQKKR